MEIQIKSLKNAFEMSFTRMAAILSRPQCVKALIYLSQYTETALTHHMVRLRVYTAAAI